MVIILLVPLWATFSYRQAVYAVHSDISSVDLRGAEVVEQGVDSCWNGRAPASFTLIRPTGPGSADQIVADLRTGFEALGYVSEAASVHTRPQRWTRERGDDLDFDVIELAVVPNTRDLEVVGDVYDVDMVFCPPF